jgi:hypothetical protein
MMSAKTRILVCLLSLAVAFGAGSARAQGTPSAPAELTPVETDTIDSFTERCQSQLENAKAETKSSKEMIEASTAKAIAQKPTTATPPPAFADRVNTSIADFLPLFQFAVNEIASSADKTSVTAKLNPIPVGIYGNLSLSTTAAQPEVFKALEEKIVEPAREAQSKSLLGKVDDFSDLTLAASYGLQRRAGAWDNTRKLFGRNYELYRNLVSDLLDKALPNIDGETDKIRRSFTKLFDDNQSIFEAAVVMDGLAPPDAGEKEKRARFGGIKLATLQQLSPKVHADLVALLKQEARISAGVTADVREAVKRNNLDAIPAMIDNQPQLVIQASYRSRDDIIGPDTAALTVNYEMGTRNFNSVLREYHQMMRNGIKDPSPLEAYRRAIDGKRYRNEDKLVFSASFLRNQRYSFKYDYMDSVTIPGSTTPVTVALDLPRSDNSRASLTWTRLWPRRTEQAGTQLAAFPTGLPQLPQVTGLQDPRTTFSVEWVNADQRIKLNNVPLENDRFVAKLSLVVPVQGGMTLPLTVVYSDKPEFLKGQDRILGAHIGISYKIGDKGTLAGQNR